MGVFLFAEALIIYFYQIFDVFEYKNLAVNNVCVTFAADSLKPTIYEAIPDRHIKDLMDAKTIISRIIIIKYRGHHKVHHK